MIKWLKYMFRPASADFVCNDQPKHKVLSIFERILKK
jgi:hypothetical protein